MIPIRDTIPSKNYPVVTFALIALHIFMYIFQPLDGFGHVAMFYNMLVFYIFGDHVEDRLGHEKYLGFILLCVITAGISFHVVGLMAAFTTISVSGMVAGVLGAYFIQYPGAKIVTFIPILVFPAFLEIPALILFILWFPLQVIFMFQNPQRINWFAMLLPVISLLLGILYFKLTLALRFPQNRAVEKLKKKTVRLKSPYLQLIKPAVNHDENDLYGMISITSTESKTGAPKIIYIPPGLYRSFFKVKIPPGTRKGNVLKLIGLGKRRQADKRGDLYLKVIID